MTDVPPGERKPLRVLQSSADPSRSGSVNPYTKLLVESLPREEVRAEYFRWSAALTSRYDLLHVHWPEHMVRSPSRLRQVAKSSAMALLLLRLRLRDTAVVRTVHNVRPHEETSPLQNWLLDRLDSMTSTWVILNDTTPTPDPSRTVLIPHGHYRDSYHPVAGGSAATRSAADVRPHPAVQGDRRPPRGLPAAARERRALPRPGGPAGFRCHGGGRLPHRGRGPADQSRSAVPGRAGAHGPYPGGRDRRPARIGICTIPGRRCLRSRSTGPSSFRRHRPPNSSPRSSAASG